MWFFATYRYHRIIQSHCLSIIIGLKARDAVYHSRDTVGRMVGGKASDIIFTSGGTEVRVEIIVLSGGQHYCDWFPASFHLLIHIFIITANYIIAFLTCIWLWILNWQTILISLRIIDIICEKRPTFQSAHCLPLLSSAVLTMNTRFSLRHYFLNMGKTHICLKVRFHRFSCILTC